MLPLFKFWFCTGAWLGTAKAGSVLPPLPVEPVKAELKSANSSVSPLKNEN